MEATETGIQNTYHKQVNLLEDLRDCLEMERESLIQVDVDQLWELMEKKNTLVLAIEKLGNGIKCLLNQFFERSPENPRATALKKWPWFSELSKQTALLKEDIQTRLKENLCFIHDTLGFFDELMDMVLKGTAERQGYEHLRKPPEASGLRIYHREV